MNDLLHKWGYLTFLFNTFCLYFLNQVTTPSFIAWYFLSFLLAAMTAVSNRIDIVSIRSNFLRSIIATYVVILLLSLVNFTVSFVCCLSALYIFDCSCDISWQQNCNSFCCSFSKLAISLSNATFFDVVVLVYCSFNIFLFDPLQTRMMLLLSYFFFFLSPPFYKLRTMMMFLISLLYFLLSPLFQILFDVDSLTFATFSLANFWILFYSINNDFAGAIFISLISKKIQASPKYFSEIVNYFWYLAKVLLNFFILCFFILFPLNLNFAKYFQIWCF